MSACVCDTDWDPPDVYHAARPLARKAHTCEECGQAIDPGDRYERAAGLYDGRWSVYKTCHRCLALRDWLEVVSCCFCWSHGGLMEEAENEIDQGNWKPGFKFAAMRLLVEVRNPKRARP